MLPVFGLYADYLNTVTITLSFTGWLGCSSLMLLYRRFRSAIRVGLAVGPSSSLGRAQGT